MKRLLITLALILVAALAIIASRDSQIPRATATLQVHPSMMRITPQKTNHPTSHTSPLHSMGR